MPDLIVLTGRGLPAAPRLLLFAPEETPDGYLAADYCALEPLEAGAELFIEGVQYFLSEPVEKGLHVAPILRVMTNEPHDEKPVTLRRHRE